MQESSCTIYPNVKFNIEIENPCEGCITLPRYYTPWPHESVIPRLVSTGLAQLFRIFLSRSLSRPDIHPLPSICSLLFHLVSSSTLRTCAHKSYDCAPPPLALPLFKYQNRHILEPRLLIRVTVTANSQLFVEYYCSKRARCF